MSSVLKKISTMGRVARARGLGGLAALVWEKTRLRWRYDDRFGLSALLGAPNDRVRLDGCKFSAGGGAQGAELRDMMLRGHHEDAERKALARFLDARSPVVEFGACIGVVSCLVNRKLAEPRRHVVVEANPDLLQTLAENREHNGCEFEIVHGAVAYGGDSVTFHLAESVLASSVRSSGGRSVTVPTFTLRDVLDRRGFERCTLICDIEGGEFDLVSHERDVLAERVETVIMEIHDRLFPDAAPEGGTPRAFEEAGFETVHSDGDVYVFRNRRLTSEDRSSTTEGRAEGRPSPLVSERV